ncbi:MAG: sulfotransferase family protein [Actinomycetes bacterium]
MPEPLDEATSERPIFVVGAHRSGTTLLQSLLGAHPRIAAPPEISFYGRIWSRRAEFGDLTDDRVLRDVVECTLDRRTLREAGFDPSSAYERARRGERTYAGVLTAVMAEFAAQHGKPRWCEKSPLQPVSWLWEQFPTAQLVHIVRDPRDSVASHRNLPWANPPPAELARRWRAFTEAALRDHGDRGPSAYLRIRYEDLARAPAPVMREVFAFLDEEFDPAVLTEPERRQATVPPVDRGWLANVLGPIRPPEEGVWRRELSRVDQLRVAAIVAPFLPGLGYEPARDGDVIAGRVVNGALAPVEQAADLMARARRKLRSATG